MIPTYKEKMHYLQTVIEPMLEESFKRGDKNYVGIYHNDHPEAIKRCADKDIEHIRELHVDIRLKEAQHAAEMEDLDEALAKIESAMGYLTILHYRVNQKLQEG